MLYQDSQAPPRPGNPRSLVQRSALFLAVILLGGCLSQRSRPYTPVDRPSTLANADALRRIEDQFIGWLIQARCEIREPAPWPWSPDLHHRIDLEFNGERILIDGNNVDRKGPLMDWEPGTMARINQCIDSATNTARGQFFPDAPVSRSLSLYLPLIPIDP